MKRRDFLSEVPALMLFALAASNVLARRRKDKALGRPPSHRQKKARRKIRFSQPPVTIELTPPDAHFYSSNAPILEAPKLRGLRDGPYVLIHRQEESSSNGEEYASITNKAELLGGLYPDETYPKTYLPYHKSSPTLSLETAQHVAYAYACASASFDTVRYASENNGHDFKASLLAFTYVGSVLKSPKAEESLHRLFEDIGKRYANLNTSEGHVIQDVLKNTKQLLVRAPHEKRAQISDNPRLVKYVTNIVAHVRKDHNRQIADLEKMYPDFDAQVHTAIEHGCQIVGIPRDVCYGIVQAESNFVYDVKNIAGLSNALGLFQYVPRSWLAVLGEMQQTDIGRKILRQDKGLAALARRVVKSGEDANGYPVWSVQPPSKQAGVLAARKNPRLAVLVGLYEAASRRPYFVSKLGKTPSPAVYWIANIIGNPEAATAIALAARKHPKKRANQLVKAKGERLITDIAIANNPLFGTLAAPKTAREIMATAEARTKAPIKAIALLCGRKIQAAFAKKVLMAISTASKPAVSSRRNFFRHFLPT